MSLAQDYDFNHMENKIAQLEEELQYRRLAEDQANEQLKKFEADNVHYRTNLQESQLRINEQRSQRKKELQNAETTFREQLVLKRANDERERTRKEENGRAELADLHKRLNEKTKNELLQQKSLQNFKKRATNIRGRLIMKKFMDEHNGRLEVREARKENDMIRKMLRDEEEKSLYFRKQLRRLKRDRDGQ